MFTLECILLGYGAAGLDMRVGHHVRGAMDVSYTKDSVHSGGYGEGQSGKMIRNSCTKLVVGGMRERLGKHREGQLA